MKFSKFRYQLLALLLAGLFLSNTAGCSAIPSIQPVVTPVPPTPTPLPTTTPFPTQEPISEDASIPLVIWIPRQFYPDLVSIACRVL